MASVKTIQHFSHGHPLTTFCSEVAFHCDGCTILDNGPRYRCDLCNFNLHEYCATYPAELSSFMHDHHLKLVFKPHAAAMGHVMNCDLCGDLVEGLFYGCSSDNPCDFTVHPICTQVPQYLWHVKDKSHPLRLQRWMAEGEGGYCFVCKNACTSWRYRCEICRLDLHLECVLAPCEEAVMSTSTPRSNSISPFPPRSSAPSDANHFATRRLPAPYSEYSYGGVPLAAGPYGGGGHHSHSYGGSNMNIPPPYSHHYYEPNIPPPPHHFDPYANSNGDHGANIHATPYFYDGVPFASPYFGSHHAHGYGTIPSYSSSGPGPAEYSSNHQQHSNSNSNHQGGGGSGGGGGGKFKKMCAIITQLAIGVASNALFGAIF